MDCTRYENDGGVLTALAGVALPTDCDPQKLMYGTDLELMDMTCVSFLDLKRINSQVKVAERYMTMMKDELACSFGMAFIKNFQRVHHILGKFLHCRHSHNKGYWKNRCEELKVGWQQ